MMENVQEVIAKNVDGSTLLQSPEVGWFTHTAARGTVLVAGQICGSLVQLGRTIRLRVPQGVSGVVDSEPTSEVRAPVGVGSVLYRLKAWSGADSEASQQDSGAAREDHGLLVRSPQAGRFYLRPAPDQDAFIEVGQELTTGVPIGLIEVMKTFNHVLYRAENGLPERARVESILVEDGAEVEAGTALISLVPAS